MKKSLILSLTVFAVATIWILSGVLAPGQSVSETSAQSAETEQTDKPLARVTVAELNARPYTRLVDVTGITQASRSVVIRAEEEGRVIALAAEKGASVGKGEALARIEMLDRDDLVGESEALVKQREIQFKAAQSLEKRGFNSQVRLAEAEAELETARANLARAKDSLEKLIITAPFEGVLSAQNVEIGDYVNRGDPAYTILDMNPLEVKAFVNEKDVLYLQEGQAASVTFLNGQSVTGQVTHVSPQADQQTRTFPVEISIANGNPVNPGQPLFPDGLTVDMHIPLEQVEAYLISPSLLTLADDGTVGVRLVDDQDVVHFTPVEILADTQEGMWVGGLPSSIRLITIGHQYVTEGQKVAPEIRQANEGADL